MQASAKGGSLAIGRGAAQSALVCETRWDSSKPDGTLRKLLDVSVLREAGWLPRIQLREGIEATVAWYRANAGAARN